METIKDLYKRLLNRHPPPPLGGPTGMHRIRFQKERKKIQKSDFFGFLFFPLLSICLDGSKPAQTVKKMIIDGRS
jgi:hypothetical protein